jgi:hypothetical protein
MVSTSVSRTTTAAGAPLLSLALRVGRLRDTCSEAGHSQAKMTIVSSLSDATVTKYGDPHQAAYH